MKYTFEIRAIDINHTEIVDRINEENNKKAIHTFIEKFNLQEAKSFALSCRCIDKAEIKPKLFIKRKG